MDQPSRPRVPEGRCLQCWLQPVFCICDQIETRETQTELVLLRHWREARKSSNTGRIATLVLPDLEVHDYGDPAVPFVRDALGLSGAHLLLPSQADSPPADSQEVKRLIIPDGTWSQSRRMCHRLGLMGLPRVQLPPPLPGVVRLRKTPAPWAMSTLEAIAMAIMKIESTTLGHDILSAHTLFVRASRAQKGLPPR